MMQSGFRDNRSVLFRVLSDDAIWEIKRAAFDILEKTGCRVMHEGARKKKKQAGALVHNEHVKVPEHIVRGCVEKAPKGLVLYDRDGNRALEVEGRKSYYGTSTASPNTRDALTGKIHETRVEDIARGALVADALPNIDWVMPMGSCQDVPSVAADVYEFEAVVTNTSKPMVFIGYSTRGNELVYEMAAEVAGGMDALREHPFLICYPEPITPLVYPEEVVERMFLAADLFLPQLAGPTQQLGATAPVTMAGAVALAVAEGLMSITLAQLRRPGTPCFMACNISCFDMSSLLQVPFIQQVIGPEKYVGIVCAQKRFLTRTHLENVGIDPDSNVLIAGAQDEYYCREFDNLWDPEKRPDRPEVYYDKAEDQMVRTCSDFVKANPGIGAIMLECTGMQPFARAVQRAVDLPIFSWGTLLDYAYSVVAHRDYYGHV